MLLIRSTTLLAAIFMISACSSVSDTGLGKSGVSKSEIAQLIQAPTNWATLAKTQNVNVDWLASFNDPALNALLIEGRSKNIDLQIAASNVEKSKLVALKSGASLKPTVNASIGASKSGAVTGSSTAKSNSLSVNASWELDVWGRLQAGVQAANASVQGAQADYKYAIHSLSANVANAYFKAIESNKQADIASTNLSLLKQIQKITQIRYDNGLSSGQDIAVSKANSASAKEQLQSLQGSHRDALRALELLIGRYPDAKSELPNTLPLLPSQPDAAIPSTILERRPDLISAERAIAAAFNLAQQAKVAQLPSFSLTAAISGASSSLSDILNPSNLAWQLAGNILAPIFDGGTRKADLKIANIDQQQAIANYVNKALKAFSEVESNLDQGLILAQRKVLLEEVLKESQRAFKIASTRYKEGEIGLLDTLTLQQQTISAQSNLLSIRRLQLEQRINLYLALGGDW
ncbi:MAG: efflux transporter outer membrane subunit [Oceanospirillaceae bacterium]